MDFRGALASYIGIAFHFLFRVSVRVCLLEPQQVMEQIDEKYLKPLLQHKSAQDSLTRVYTKVVLA